LISRYGVDNISKLKEVKIKKKKTTYKNFGVENPFQSEEIKEKIKDKLIDKYGVDHPLKSKKIIDKKNKTCIERYGTNNYQKSEFSKNFTSIKKDKNYIKYIGESLYLFNCENGHDYEIKYDNYYHRNRSNITLCTTCYPISEQDSIKERELFDFIKSNYSSDIIKGYRDELEIDIYLPELKIGFEFNGLYWHSNIFKDNNYHLNKTNHFKEKNIRIFHIWEDDWSYKKEIIKSQILNMIGKSNCIYARKCDIRLVDNSKDFLNENHLIGKDRSCIRIGLYHDNKLVSIMSFDRFEGRNKMGDGEYNLSRFCNLLNTNVVGGASKLLSYFIKKYKPKRIISYADKDWSIGGLYYKLGFNNINESRPDYKYVVGDKRKHKSNYRKSKTGISEKDLNINKIFDCGKIKFELKLEQF